MNGQYYWMNCGYCGVNVGMRPPGSLKFYLTSCSFIFCHGCARPCRQPACFSCHTICKVLPISNQMPPNVRHLVKIPAEDVANLKQAIAFHQNQFDKVIGRMGKLINHHQMELAQARQKAQDTVLRLKELNSKIPEAQQTLEKLQKTVKMLTTTNDRHNRSGDFKHGRSGGGLNAGMGTFMEGQNRGLGGNFGGQNGGGGGNFGGQNGSGGGNFGGQNRGLGGNFGGQNGGLGGNFGGQNGGGGGNFGGQNRGPGGNFGGQNGGMERFMDQNRGMGGLVAGQNGGFGNFMGVQSKSMGVSMAGQGGRMLNNMAVQGNSGGRGSNSGQRPTNPSLF